MSSRRATIALGLLLVAVIAGVAVWVGFFRATRGSVHTVTVERRAELSATVQATGKVDVTGKLPIPLPQAGDRKSVV